MGSFAIIPRPIYYNGVPASGAKVYTYLTGTTTPKATYPTAADADAGTNANANPIIANSNGYLSTEIWLASDDHYKIIIKTSDDATTIWSVDDVTGAGDSAITSIVDSNGNTVLDVSAAASAVNYLEIANAASGSNPSFTAAGSDTNIGINLVPKGSGSIVASKLSSTTATLTTANITTANVTTLASGTEIGAESSSVGGLIKILEGTTNGTNYVGIRGPASVSSNVTYTLPSSDGSDKNTLVTNGSGVLSFLALGPKAVNVYTANDTWTRGANTTWGIVIAVGGGGGGGGAIVASANDSTAGSGGGGGGTGVGFLTASQMGSSQTITVGSGGSAGSSSGGNGGNGGSSSFGTVITATGGGAGSGMSAASQLWKSGGAGGTGGGTGLTFKVIGDDGGNSAGYDDSAGSPKCEPQGGFGGGTWLAGQSRPSIQATGTTGSDYGGGGSGSMCPHSTGGYAGGAGAAGVVIVIEF